ncbi:MAG: PIN domain-containing protein, partial [Candidatus Aenigmarchaeota archaeon]|nr:PIN domain-containing protein [Candidatus Aenigmarchaeota archaeon]MDI6721998.1 PIN domain-containing protein [Candidatus Aenigmarchaeota archaeon]
KYVDEEMATCILNLYELHYIMIKSFGEEKAKSYFHRFKNMALEIRDEWIFLASKFKLEMSKENISFADALGYAIAKDNGMKFLTGDKEFRDLPNVEFVK